MSRVNRMRCFRATDSGSVLLAASRPTQSPCATPCALDDAEKEHAEDHPTVQSACRESESEDDVDGFFKVYSGVKSVLKKTQTV